MPAHIRILPFLLLFVFSFSAKAQGDECDNALLLTDVNDFCSANAAYTSSTSTQSGFGAPGCWTNSNNDVWFKFVAVATDVRIFVYGNIGGGGSLPQPEVALYTGDCAGTINETECESAVVGDNFVSLYRAGLTVGTTYYIRVDGRNNGRGTFKLCVNNFNPIPQPGQDCSGGTFLCNGDKVSFDFRPGAGANPDEAANTCLDDGSSNSESASLWVKFVATTSGTLTFVLSPTDPADDLDFALFSLPNGVNNCNGKTVNRCNAAGDSFFPSPCMGPTGLELGDADINEDIGCTDAGDDSWSKEANLVAGQAYALLVNNYTSSGNGFSLEFGGSASIASLIADYDVTSSGSCGAVDMTFTDQSINADTWNWNFGPGASIPSASTKGPHNVTFQPGTHTVVLTITNTTTGCTDFKDTSFTIPPSTLDITNTPTNPTCGAPDGQILVTVTPGTAPYRYSKDGGSTYTAAQAAATYTFTGLTGGSYDIRVQDANGCEVEKTVVLATTNAVTITSTSATQENCTAQDGTVTVNVSGGTTPYQYSIDGGPATSSAATTFTFTGLDNGSHTVSVKDNTACPAVTATVNVTVKDNLTLSTSKQDARCGFNNGSITLTVGGGTTPYQFSKDNGTTFSPGTSPFTFSSLAPGSYTVIARDVNGCQKTATVTIANLDNLATSAVTVTDAVCNPATGSIVFTITGGTAPYSWEINGSTVSTNNNTSHTFSGLSGGSYTVEVTDQFGCTESATRNVQNFPGISQLALTGTPQQCGDNQGEIRAVFAGGTPPFRFSINNGSTFPYTGIAVRDYTITGLGDGTFNVVVEDSKGCRDTAQVTLAGLPFISNVSVTKKDELCIAGNGQISISVTGGTPNYSFQLNANPAVSSASTSHIFPNLAAGSYTVTVNDNSGCPAKIQNVTIARLDSFSSITVTKTDAICGQINGSISVRANGGTPNYVYSINGLPAPATPSNTQSYNPLPAGVYSIKVTDRNGCEETRGVTVNDIDNFSIVAISTDSAWCNANNGEINVSLSTGQGPYSYSLNGGPAQSSSTAAFTIDSLAPGNYNIVFTAANGCTEDTAVTVHRVADISSVTNTIADDTCTRLVGSVNMAVTGGNTPFQFSINNGPFTAAQGSPYTFESLGAGNYILVVKDRYNCADTSTVVVGDKPGVKVTDVVITDATCEQSNGSLLAVISNPNDSAVFVWTDAAGNVLSDTLTLDSIPGGSYSFLAADTAGCRDSVTVEVSTTFLPIFEALKDTFVLEGESFMLELEGETGGTIVWTPDATLSCDDCITPVSTPDTTTTYVVSVTNADGCISYDTVTVMVKYIMDAYLPSAFTPNRDGLNDIFFVNGKNVQLILAFQVYNRTGGKMFERYNFPPNDQQYGWDGVYRNKKQNVDSYIWYCEALLNDGRVKSYKGVVDILR